jgi:DNA-binding MarR family transcriptional regulator
VLYSGVPRPPATDLVDADELDLEPVLAPDPLDLQTSLSSLVHWADSEFVRREIMAAVEFPSTDLLDFLAVNQLTLRGALRATDLAAALQTSRSNLSKVARRLAGLDLAVRAPDPQDERGVLLALTAAGRVTGRRIVEHNRSRLQETLADWSGADVEQLQHLLARFAATIPPTARTRR